MGRVEFVLLLALSMSLVALSIDAVLPALSYIGEEMRVDENRRQLVIGALFVGFALAQCIFGPLSDSIGRRRSMLFAVGVFLIGCLVSIFAPNFEVMLIGRFIQGLGAGGPRTLGVAVIRDRFEGSLMAKTLSLVMTVFILVPVLGPTIGQVVLTFAAWRGIFWMYVVVALVAVTWMWLRLPETLPPSRRHPFHLGRIGRAVLEVVRTRVSLGYLLATGFIYSGFIGYLTSSQQVLQEAYGLGVYFPVVFGLLAASIGVSSFVNSQLVVRLGMHRLARGSLATFFSISVLFLIATAAFDGLPPLWVVFVAMVPMFFCVGLLFGNLNALAMQPMGHIAGTAAAVIGAGQTVISAGLGSLVGQSFDGTALPFAAGFCCFAGCSLLCAYWAEPWWRRA